MGTLEWLGRRASATTVGHSVLVDRMGRGIQIAALAIVGLGVVLFIWASNRPDWKPTLITEVTATSDSADLSVTVSHSQCRRDPRVQVVDESSEAVRLRAEQDQGGGCDDIGLSSEISVRLNTELGTRRVELEEPPSSEGTNISCVVDSQISDRCVANLDP